MRRTRNLIHQFVDDRGSTKLAKAFNGLIMLLIAWSVLGLVISSIPGFSEAANKWFRNIEFFTVVVFTFEYFLRIYTAPEHIYFKRKKYPRLAFAVSFYGLVDLLSILPYLLGVFFDAKFLRVIRILRFVRVLKLSRYLEATTIFRRVLLAKRPELSIVIIVLLTLLFFSSVVIYYIEHEAQPDVFVSIPHSMWWAVSTLTTVGYGDMVPITPWGKVIGGLVSFMGVGTFALPAGILASGFTDYWKVHKTNSNIKNVCPHCGKII
jgi:voltage-gated potassium channel